MFDDIITEKPKIIKAQKKSRLEELVDAEAESSMNTGIGCGSTPNTKGISGTSGPAPLPDGWQKTKTPKGKTIIKRSA